MDQVDVKPRYYDRAGKPIPTMEWSSLFGIADYQCVARDEVGGVVVSTVWLGLDHNFLGHPPHIFETMIFGGEDDEYCERYATEADALAGHACAVERVRAAPARP